MFSAIFTYGTALTVPYELALPDAPIGLGEFLVLMVVLVIVIRLIRGDWPFEGW